MTVGKIWEDREEPEQASTNNTQTFCRKIQNNNNTEKERTFSFKERKRVKENQPTRHVRKNYKKKKKVLEKFGYDYVNPPKLAKASRLRVEMEMGAFLPSESTANRITHGWTDLSRLRSNVMRRTLHMRVIISLTPFFCWVLRTGRWRAVVRYDMTWPKLDKNWTIWWHILRISTTNYACTVLPTNEKHKKKYGTKQTVPFRFIYTHRALTYFNTFRHLR